MSRWRTEKFERTCVVDFPSKIDSTSPDMDSIINSEKARRAIKFFKKVKNSGEGNATVLPMLYLDAAITPTVEILSRTLLGKDQLRT